MSDLVRGIHRGGEPPAKPPREPGSPPPSPEEAAQRSSLRFPTEPGGPPAEPPPAKVPSAPPEERPPEAEAADHPEQLYAELLGFTARLAGLVRERREFPWAWYERLVGRVVRSLEESAELLWLASAPPAARVEYLSTHLAQVGVLAIQIGRGLGYAREQLVDLGMAAFLFDVGLLELPADLLSKPEPLGGEALAAFQGHARHGAEIVRRWGAPRAGIVEAILQHHERENGHGYPQQLSGAAIHPHAKILGLVDAYTGLIFPRPPGRRLPPYEAIREMVRSRQEEFPAPLIKALLSEVSVFPPRTVVRLSTGEVGRVIAVNRHHPLRPKVEIVADAKGYPLAVPKVLDLAEAPFVYVTGPVTQEGR